MNRSRSAIRPAVDLPVLVLGPDRAISRQELWREIESSFLDWVEDRLESHADAEEFLRGVQQAINN